MSDICFIGDIHFSSSKSWSNKVCNAFLDWYKNWKYNSEDNYVVFLGDIVDSATNGGEVISYLERLYNYSKFKEIHIVVGNHDKKKIDNKDQLAYEFYKEKSNVFIYEVATETTINNHKCLMLPYYIGVNENNLSMSEYYSNLDKYYKPNDFDFICGHFGNERVAFGGDCIKNLDYFHCKKILGHIHTRYCDRQSYCGSVFACNKTENDESRCTFILNSYGEWLEESLPQFNEFITFTYGQRLPRSSSQYPIYTILNCSNEELARKKYGDILIRKVVSSSNELNDTVNIDREIDDIKHFNTQTLFDEFIKHIDSKFSNEVISKCREYLKG